MFFIKNIRLILFFVFILKFSSIFSQTIKTIQCDFSLKTYFSEENQELTLGTIYFDVETNIIQYNISFPRKEKWVLKDSIIHRIREDTILSETQIMNINQYSIFNMCLNGSLLNYGLEDAGYNIFEIETNNNNLITTWQPPDKKHDISKITISNSENKLDALIVFDKRGKITTKYFFDNYYTSANIIFPCEIIKILYSKKNEVYELTTFKNLSFNNSCDFYIFNN